MSDGLQTGQPEPPTVPPSSVEQVRFLVNVQRLLDEGLLVATYKYALLLSIADLCIERGDDSGAPLPLATEDIAERFRSILTAPCRAVRAHLAHAAHLDVAGRLMLPGRGYRGSPG